VTRADTPAVAVIGGGIAGLTAAYRISRTRDGDGRTPVVMLLEATDRLGGAIETVTRDGFLVERGPDSMITEKPWGMALCREVGLEDAILPTNTASRGSFIVRGRALHPVPDGFHLMAPSRLLPFARSGLLSWKGKLRVAMEPFVPARRDVADESLADFVRRRLGVEALTRIAQPMVGGIYTADPERLSLQATLPRFPEMERTHGSVVCGLMAARRRAGSGVANARGPRYQLFVSLREGMEQLPRKLAQLLPDGVVHLRTNVKAIRRTGTRWRIETSRGAFDSDGVCIAVPAHAAGSLLERISPDAARELQDIEHASTATVTLAYRRSDIIHPLNGFGFVVPAEEGRTTLACTFNSVKFAHRAPEGFVLMRAFVGGALFPEAFELDDGRMVAAVEADLRDLIGAPASALWSIVTRYPRSMPQYHVGHLERVSRIQRALSSVPGLVLAGNAYLGAGIPDTIRSANESVERLATALQLNAA
jgi:oxygen-dependent protoporphyrinogen oxidase